MYPIDSMPIMPEFGKVMVWEYCRLHKGLLWASQDLIGPCSAHQESYRVGLLLGNAEKLDNLCSPYTLSLECSGGHASFEIPTANSSSASFTFQNAHFC